MPRAELEGSACGCARVSWEEQAQVLKQSFWNQGKRSGTSQVSQMQHSHCNVKYSTVLLTFMHGFLATASFFRGFLENAKWKWIL